MEETLNNWLFENAKTIAKNYVSTVVPMCKKFKIGKTGESLEDRKNQPDYSGTYDHIEEVYQSSSKDKVSEMEAYLIDEFEHLDKCMNKKDGDDSLKDTMADASVYRAYVVWKES